MVQPLVEAVRTTDISPHGPATQCESELGELENCTVSFKGIQLYSYYHGKPKVAHPPGNQVLLYGIIKGQ